MQTYELKTSRGVVAWAGCDGPDAARRWAACHRGETVFAWREPRNFVTMADLAELERGEVTQ